MPNDGGIPCLELEVEWTMSFVLTSWDLYCLQRDAVQHWAVLEKDNMELFQRSLRDRRCRFKVGLLQRDKNLEDVQFLSSWTDQVLLRSIRGLASERGKDPGRNRQFFKYLKGLVERNDFMAHTMKQ